MFLFFFLSLSPTPLQVYVRTENTTSDIGHVNICILIGGISLVWCCLPVNCNLILRNVLSKPGLTGTPRSARAAVKYFSVLTLSNSWLGVGVGGGRCQSGRLMLTLSLNYNDSYKIYFSYLMTEFDIFFHLMSILLWKNVCKSEVRMMRSPSCKYLDIGSQRRGKWGRDPHWCLLFPPLKILSSSAYLSSQTPSV